MQVHPEGKFIVNIHHACLYEQDRNDFCLMFFLVSSVTSNALSCNHMLLQSGRSGPPIPNPACTFYPFTSFFKQQKHSVPAHKHQITVCQWIKYAQQHLKQVLTIWQEHLTGGLTTYSMRDFSLLCT